jgi:hypothetical protein
LGIDDCCTGFSVFSSSLSHLLSQLVMNLLPNPHPLPVAQVLIDRLPSGKITG